MDLSILIVTYNSARWMDALLQRLQAELGRIAAEVVVVDNASKDETVETVRRHHPWVRLVVAPHNLGFAAGVNRCAELANGRHLLLLNPDAVPEPGAVARGLALMDAHPDTAMGGGALYGVDGRLQPSARMFPTLLDEFFVMSGLSARHPRHPLLSRLDRGWADPTAPAEVDWIPGAFVYLQRAIFVSLGGFDERYFLYYEELDLCRRLRTQGMKVRYWPELRAMHRGGESARTVEGAHISQGGGQLESWRMRSALLYYRKHHGLPGALGLRALEQGWRRGRQLKAALKGQRAKAAALESQCALLLQAWRDTAGGLRSPPVPW